MATFGYSTIGSVGTDPPANNIVWCKATSSPASNGTLTAINLYCNGTGTGPTLCLALYTDSSGAPGTRIVANETPVSVPATAGWVSLTFSQAIVAGTQYWFGLRVPSGDEPSPPAVDIYVAYDANGSLTELYYKQGSVSGPETDVFPASVSGATSVANARWSIYGTYTPSGGAQDTPELYGSPRLSNRQMQQLLAQ